MITITYEAEVLNDLMLYPQMFQDFLKFIESIIDSGLSVTIQRKINDLDFEIFRQIITKEDLDDFVSQFN